MSPRNFESILNNVLLAFQLCLGLWQFMKLTPVGALIQGVVGWLLQHVGLSQNYTPLQTVDGRVFKRAQCFVLQAEIPSERRAIEAHSQDTLSLSYLGRVSNLERKGSEGNSLFIDGKMCYYINRTIWGELEILESVLQAGDAAAAAAGASAAGADDYAAAVAAESVLQDGGDRAAAVATVSAAVAIHNLNAAPDVTDLAAAGNAAAVAAADAAAVVAAAAVDAAAAAAAAARLCLKGQREFWQGVTTGGVMTLAEVLDGVILYNQHVSSLLSDSWLLPVNLSVSEEKLLKIINLFGLFLQTKKEKVHWLIPASLSLISAILEFSTPLRVWFYNKVNVLFCHIMHFICNPLPLSWRRQIYSLGHWVDNLRPSNDIQLKIGRRNIRAIIGAGAKVDKEGATLVPLLDVPWLDVMGEDFIHKQFRYNSIPMICNYHVSSNKCLIYAPMISWFRVECKSMEEFSHIITLISCIAENGSGSLKTCESNKKVYVRGFEESLRYYVKNGCPPIYQLELENVVLT